MLAWHAANIMNMWAKRGHRITARKLLGPEPGEVQKRSVKDFTSIEELNAAVDAHNAKIEEEL